MSQKGFTNPIQTISLTVVVILFSLGLAFIAFGDFSNGNCVMNADCVVYTPVCGSCDDITSINHWLKPFLRLHDEAWCIGSNTFSCDSDLFIPFCSPKSVCDIKPDCERFCSLRRDSPEFKVLSVDSRFRVCGCLNSDLR